LALTFLAAVIGIVVNLLSYAYPSALSASVYLFMMLAFLSILTAVVGQVVFGPGRVTAHRVRGAVVLYLHLALILTFLQAIVLFFSPGAFGEALVTTDASVGQKLLYFSFTTLTTVSYGDIVPVHPYARSLANLEAIIGQLYPATLLAHNHIGIAGHALDAAQRLGRFLAEHDALGSCLRVGKRKVAVAHVVPLEGLDLAEPRAGEHQQTDRGNDRLGFRSIALRRIQHAA
jgi:hypothetical protein